MHIQDVVWTIALSGIGLIALAFVYVISRARRPADDAATTQAARTARRIQARLFAALLAVFAVGSWATLRHFPIPPQRALSDVQQVVEVVGGQWYWTVEPTSVEAGRTVEFRVTSADVNHGFAIYAPDGRIVTQTQAMPGYTNRLRYSFDEPGTYTLQCLEYCGIGHAPMTAAIEVTTASGGSDRANSATAGLHHGPVAPHEDSSQRHSRG